MYTIEHEGKILELTPRLRYKGKLQQMCLYPAISGGEREELWVDIEEEGMERIPIIEEDHLELCPCCTYDEERPCLGALVGYVEISEDLSKKIAAARGEFIIAPAQILLKGGVQTFAVRPKTVAALRP